MNRAPKFIRLTGIDALTAVVLIATLYLLSRPLRDRWHSYRADRHVSDVAARKWTELETASSPMVGDKANSQLMEISDYECPFCRKTSAAVDSAEASGISVSYLDYPLSIHPHAEGAAIAALCAQSSGQFREMHSQLMRSTEWQQDTNWVREAKAAGIKNLGTFEECLHGRAVRDRLALERALADSLGVTGTPMFLSKRSVHRGTATATELIALGSAK